MADKPIGPYDEKLIRLSDVEIVFQSWLKSVKDDEKLLQLWNAIYGDILVIPKANHE